ncbi:MAG TPA: protein phosphatase 2C domain-containing protein [Kofleriaceae bacterium]|nr:protein phosphatase 2C domain-containing protein [Kofleriaceae bacterium]
MTVDAQMVTDVGVVRDHNEDSAHIDDAKEFFIVADGMGGHAAGEVASAMAVETVMTTISESRATIEGFAKQPSDAGRREIVQLLQNAVLAAHQAVFQRGNRESDKQGMGTTLDVVLIAGHEAFVAHVGDSRTYLIRDGRAAQITTDHTVAEVLVIEGKLSIEEAQVSPLRTILVNAIGVSADVGVEMAHLQLRRGDRILLCSDGLHDYFVAEQEIADKLSSSEPGKSLAEMVELAKERGGHDNITGIVVNVIDVGGIEAVPGVIELDQTQPVTVPPPPPGAWDDENTENIQKEPAKDDEPAGGSAAASEAATRETEPMQAISLGEPPPAIPPTTERVTAPLKVVSKDDVAKLRAEGEAKDAARRKKAGGKKSAKDEPPASGDDPTVEAKPAKPGPDKK